MSYAPLDDRLDEHPKYAELGAAEMGILVCAITYSTRNLSDGRVPKVWPTRRFGREGSRLATRMVQLGIWSVRPDGDFEIVGFLEHNPSRDEVLAKRHKRADAGRRGGLASWEQRSTAKARASPSGEAPAEASASASAVAPAEPLQITTDHFTSEQRDHAPPDEVPIEPRPTVAPTPRTIDPKLAIDADSREYATQLGIVEVDIQWRRFVDKCIAKGELSTDFRALFRSRCPFIRNDERRQRDQDRASPTGSGAPSSSPDAREAVLARERAQDAEHARLRRETVPPTPERLGDLLAAVGAERASGVMRKADAAPVSKSQGKRIEVQRELTPEEIEARRAEQLRAAERLGTG